MGLGCGELAVRLQLGVLVVKWVRVTKQMRRVPTGKLTITKIESTVQRWPENDVKTKIPSEIANKLSKKNGNRIVRKWQLVPFGQKKGKQ